MNKPSSHYIYFTETTHIRFFGSTQSSRCVFTPFSLFFSFARHHTKFYLSGTFFRIRSPSCGIVFPLSLCVRSFEIIVYALLCLHLYLFICVWFFPLLVRAFILSFSFHFRFPFVIHVFDGFSHSKQHTSANTLNTLTFIVGVPRQPSNLFHYQWIFIEHQISTWHIIWFSYFPIFVLFFGLSAWDVRVCVCAWMYLMSICCGIVYVNGRAYTYINSKGSTRRQRTYSKLLRVFFFSFCGFIWQCTITRLFFFDWGQRIHVIYKASVAIHVVCSISFTNDACCFKPSTYEDRIHWR